jgi:TP901 family phage tail tape measure protein
MAKQTVTINFLANAGQAQNAINNLSRSLSGLSGPIGQASPALGRMVSGMGAIVGPAALVAGGVASIGFALRGMNAVVDTAAKFEAGMQRIRSVVQEDGGDVTANMEYMGYVAREAGKNTRFSATEAAAGLEELAKAGYSAGDAAKSLNSVLLLSQASGMAVGETSGKVADMMTAFGADASETGHFVDVLAMTAAKSTTDIYELSEAFKYVGVAGAGMGMEFDQVAAALGVVAGAGVKASMAGTAIRGTLIQLADSSSAAHGKLLELGLTTEEIRPGKLNQLDQIMKRLKDKGVDANTAYAIFGQRAGVAANVFTTFYDSLVDFNGILDDADGAAQRMADTMDDSLEASFIKLKNAWEELKLVLSEGGLMTGLRSVVDTLRVKILQLAELIQVLRNAAAAGQLGKVLSSMFKFVVMDLANGLFSMLTLVFKLAVTYLSGQFNTLMDPAYWQALFATFAAIGFVLIGSADKLIAALLEAGGGFTVNLVAGVMFVIDTLRGGFLLIGGLFVASITKGLSNIIESMRGALEWAGVNVDSVLAKLSGVGEAAMGASEGGEGLLGKTFEQTKADAQNIVGGMIDGLREGGDNMLTEADNAATHAYDKASEAFRNNMIDPLGKTLKEHEPSEVFDTSKVEREIADAYARFRPTPPKPPADEDKGGKTTATDAGGSGNNGLGGGLAGANRMATNLIMGRTINEVIAQIAKDQLDAAEDMVEEQKKTTAAVASLKNNGGVATFA